MCPGSRRPSGRSCTSGVGRGSATFLCMALFMIAPSHADDVPRSVFASSIAFVVPVKAVDANGQTVANLSAVSLGGGRFVSRCGELSGRFEAPVGGEAKTLTLLARDPDSSLCLLESSGAALAAAPLAGLPEAGTRVFALGNALGLGIGISEGVVSKLHRLGEAERIQFTAAIATGSEGGGLFDADGRLLGIIDRPLDGGQNVNLAVPAAGLADIAARAASRSAERAEYDALLARADELRAARNWSGLLEHARDWVARRPQDAEGLRARAEAAESGGDTSAARTDYEQALTLDGELRSAAFGLWRTRSATGDASALHTAQMLAERWPMDVDAWMALSRSHAARTEYEAAERAARHALSLQPWHASPHFMLASLAQSRGDKESWMRHRRELHELLPNEPSILMGYIEALIANARLSRALALIDAYPGSDSNGDLIYFRGLVLMAASKPMEALATLKRSLAHTPNQPAWVWASIGDMNAVLGMPTQAVEAYRKAVELDPEQHNWRWKLALALTDAFLLDEASGIFREWTARWPESPDGWRQLGFVYAIRGEDANAIQALERSLSLDARQPRTWHVLVDAYAVSGRDDDVRRAWSRLRDLDPERAEAARLRRIVPLEIAP